MAEPVTEGKKQRANWQIAYLSLGANEGNRRSNILAAIELLGRQPTIEVVQQSSLVETEPEGGPSQRKFINAVIKIRTCLDPELLLQTTQAVERALGRQRSAVRWGPRAIDVDILLYGKEIVRSLTLCIPHPRMHRRFFVLRPLSELSPQLKHPELNKTVSRLLRELTEQNG